MCNTVHKLINDWVDAYMNWFMCESTHVWSRACMDWCISVNECMSELFHARGNACVNSCMHELSHVWMKSCRNNVMCERILTQDRTITTQDRNTTLCPNQPQLRQLVDSHGKVDNCATRKKHLLQNILAAMKQIGPYSIHCDRTRSN